MKTLKVVQGDCLDVLKEVESSLFDLVYLDPPFFTRKNHELSDRDGKARYSFSDKWGASSEYYEFLLKRLHEFRRVLKDTGSIFFHCDKTASHLARMALEEVFGPENFRAEIIWTYRRWSNSSRGLLPAHQSIHFFSKSRSYKFNHLTTGYSPSTNLDQILQERTRDERNKSVYAREADGSVRIRSGKKGVPLSDVWDIPFLNPKARERVGYPTQKPILLLERILQIATDEGDVILDPFVGSGTTLVTCALMKRYGLGIDVSAEAVELAKTRIANPGKTESRLLMNGRSSYVNGEAFVEMHLQGIPCHRVHRNSGIDALLISPSPHPIPIRVQRPSESLAEAAHALIRASESKGAKERILVRTHTGSTSFLEEEPHPAVRIVDSLGVQLKELTGDP